MIYMNRTSIESYPTHVMAIERFLFSSEPRIRQTFLGKCDTQLVIFLCNLTIFNTPAHFPEDTQSFSFPRNSTFTFQVEFQIELGPMKNLSPQVWFSFD